MAEEEKKDEEKKDEEKKEEKKEKKEGGSKLILIIVIVLLVLLLIVAGVLVMMMSGDDEEDGDKPKEEATEQKVEVEAAPKKAKLKMKATNNKDYVSVGTIVPAGTFIVNLLSDSGKKYLKTDISIELVTDDVMPELEMKKAVLQHIIMTILSQKTGDEVSTRKGKEKLQAQIVYEINEALADGKIKHVFFTKFVIQ